VAAVNNSTASTLERDSKCPANRALPVVQRTTEEAIGGTANHTKIEGGLEVGGDISHLPRVVQSAMEGATAVHVEAAFAINVDTGFVRFIGYSIGRNYGPLSTKEIALTVDAIIIRPDGTWVWDWKSRKRVTSAKENLQLRAGGVAVLKWLGLSSVNVALGYLDDGEKDEATVDVFDAEAFFEAMQAMHRRIGLAREAVEAGRPPMVHQGSWCDYCPALPYCPAHARLALTMIAELDHINNQIAMWTPEQAGLAWTKVKQIQSLAERVEESIKLRARQSVVPLPGGKRLALVPSSRTSPDGKRALAKLQELGVDTSDYQKTSYFDVVREVKA
jgi:hypothetical protein